MEDLGQDTAERKICRFFDERFYWRLTGNYPHKAELKRSVSQNMKIDGGKKHVNDFINRRGFNVMLHSGPHAATGNSLRSVYSSTVRAADVATTQGINSTNTWVGGGNGPGCGPSGASNTGWVYYTALNSDGTEAAQVGMCSYSPAPLEMVTDYKLTSYDEALNFVNFAASWNNGTVAGPQRTNPSPNTTYSNQFEQTDFVSAGTKTIDLTGTFTTVPGFAGYFDESQSLYVNG